MRASGAVREDHGQPPARARADDVRHYGSSRANDRYRIWLCTRPTPGTAAAVRTSVEQALMSAVPGLRATIQLLPSDVEAHFDDEKDLI